MKTAQTQKETLFFVNVTFVKLKLAFNCSAIWKNIVSATTQLISSRCENRLVLPYDFLIIK
jgi:hypothetical protein